jgi:hypothetical protein
MTTTTKPKLETELATRMFGAPIDASPGQTRRVMQSIAGQWAGGTAGVIDPAPWIELQEWLAGADHTVVIPFLHHVEAAIPPDAARLRRDFGALATLIASHAMLRQTGRARDPNGNIVATVEDYAAVRDLVADIVAEGVGASVQKQVRDVVAAMPALGGSTRTIMAKEIADHLGWHKTTVEPYIEQAIENGWLKDLRKNLGAPRELMMGAPLTAEREVLPTAEVVRAAITNPAP